MVNVNRLLFSDGKEFDPTWIVKASQLDQARFKDLTAMYIAYFNRAPDALGLEYWASRLVDGMSLIEIAKSFFVQPETIATYPPSMSTMTDNFAVQAETTDPHLLVPLIGIPH